MEFKIGIDLGSTAIKAVIVKELELIWKKTVPTTPGQEALALQLIAEGLADSSIRNIIKGLHESIARRITGMLGNQDIEDDLYLDGGSANNGGLAAAIEDEIFRNVNVLDYPQFTVAYGAACLLKR